MPLLGLGVMCLASAAAGGWAVGMVQQREIERCQYQINVLRRQNDRIRAHVNRSLARIEDPE